MKKNIFKLLAIFFIFLEVAAFIPTLHLDTHIKTAKLVNYYGPPQYRTYAQPGNILVMIRVISSDQMLNYGASEGVVLIDNQGNKFPQRGYFNVYYVFEIPESAATESFTLVVNRWIRLPVNGIEDQR